MNNKAKLLFIPFISYSPKMDTTIFAKDYVETLKRKHGSVAVVREGEKSRNYHSYEKLSDIDGVREEDLNRYKD